VASRLRHMTGGVSSRVLSRARLLGLSERGSGRRQHQQCPASKVMSPPIGDHTLWVSTIASTTAKSICREQEEAEEGGGEKKHKEHL